LSYFLAHIYDNDYALLSLFDNQPSDAPPLEERIGDVKIRWGGALPVLWAYLWGLHIPSDTSKGKEKARDTERLFQEAASGHHERSDETHALIIETTFRLLLASVQRSASNLFLLSNKLDLLCEFLLYRLYGPPTKRVYVDTFPAKIDWADRGEEDERRSEWDWKAPSPGLREVYLSLLRKVLEAGVNQKVTWRLFELVKTTEADRRKKDEGILDSGTSTPINTAPPTPTRPSRTQTPTPGADDTTTTLKSRKRPQLTLATTAPPPVADMERLDVEVLDLLRHAMRSRWPDMFVFRGGKGISEAGIELPDLGRAWPGAQKGFHFSVSSVSVTLELSRLTVDLDPHQSVEPSVYASSRNAVWQRYSSAQCPRELANQL
jgi:hypothetical protein